MDALVELLIEVIGQLFGEIILEAIAHLFAALFKVFETNGRLKRIIKYTIVYVFFALVFGLLIFSVFTKKGLYIQVVLIYLIVMLFVYFFKFINRNIFKNQFAYMIRIITSILHYALGVSIIVVTAMNTITKSGVILIILSSISIVIFLIIDIFRIIRTVKKKRILQQK